MSTFVCVGNARQPFHRLLDAVVRLASGLPQPVIVQRGPVASMPTPCQSVDFLDMDAFTAHVEQANLLILHAGAGAVITALQAGKVPVIAPRRACFAEHVDDHQVEFAHAIARTGMAIVAEDMDQLPAAIGQALLRQRSDRRPKVTPPLAAMVGKILARYASRLP